jgi:hypothetical protein
VAELVDNSLQAEAQNIWITTPANLPNDVEPYVAVQDDGKGMSVHTLARALQFGGSERFNDRGGLGRYGMGLPNSSLSQARCVEVFTWQKSGEVWRVDFDLDIACSSPRPHLPQPARATIPNGFTHASPRSGTLIIWKRLDRVQRTARRWTTVARRLHTFIGQVFRFYIWEGISIFIDGAPVIASDPLFLVEHHTLPILRACSYGEVLYYNVRLEDMRDTHRYSPDASAIATIEVRFSELPVETLVGLSNSEKRALGIVNRAGVSVVRAGREIDYGWFFINKRRENYDDWWRCEVRFPPSLDEMFGVTHTKQGIRPSESLRQILTEDMTAISRVLSRRVRTAHLVAATERERLASARQASAGEAYLRPLPTLAWGEDKTVQRQNEAEETAQILTQQPLSGWEENGVKYRIALEETWERDFFRVERDGQELVLILNTQHEFYQAVYAPLLTHESRQSRTVRHGLELFLLSLARTSQLSWNENERATLTNFVNQWSRAASVFCRPAAGRRN